MTDMLEQIKSDRDSEARKAEGWFQRCSELEAENARLRTHAFALEQRLANRDNQSFVRDISLNKSIDNAVDAFVKAAAERDDLERQLAECQRQRADLAKEWVQAQHDRGLAQAEVMRLTALLRKARGCMGDEKPESYLAGKSWGAEVRREIDTALAGLGPLGPKDGEE